MTRKSIYTILAILLITLPMFADNSGIFVYRHDGRIYAFPDNRVDSIVYSECDTLGKVHDTPVTQIIYTPDSIFRIAMSDIDSVMFVDNTPITAGEVVDMGLGVKWASHNVGATSPEQSGGYFAWGETEEKSNYTFDAYSDPDYKLQNIISGTQYDVAHVKLGGAWRMPMTAEITELLERCPSKWMYYN